MKSRLAFAVSLLALLAGPSVATQGPELTDCSKGCTIITCEAALCAVNVHDPDGWRIATTYPNPAPQDAASRPSPSGGEAAGKPSPKKEGDMVLSPTTAAFQLAKVCRSNDEQCTYYTVTVHGATPNN